MDLISRDAAYNVLTEYYNHKTEVQHKALREALDRVPSVEPDDWLENNKDLILQAGMEGREVEFRIGGRLFAIREKAQ